MSLGLPPLTITFTLPLAPPTLSTSEGSAVVNGGFETGDLTGWTPGGLVTPTIETSSVYGGNYSAQLGAVSPSGTPADSWLVETLTIPAHTKSLNLVYWLSNPNSDSSNYFEIWIQDTAGEQLNRLTNTSSNSSAWQVLQLSLFSKYTGNTIQIYFNVHQDGSSNPVYAYLDNIQIN